MENASMQLENGNADLQMKIECPELEIDENQHNDSIMVPNEKRLEPIYVSNNHTFNLWTSKATSCLISQYKKYRSLVGQTNQFRSLRDMFDTISLEMQKHGFFFSPQKCENKWRVLERKYKNLMMREMIRKPGRIKHYGHWEHKKALEEIFNEKKKSVYLPENENHQIGSSTTYALILPKSVIKTTKPSPTNSRTQEWISDNEKNPITDKDPLATVSNTSVSNAEESESTESRNVSLKKIFLEIKKLFEISEENNERRHAEKMALYQKKLKIHQKLLEIEEQKLDWKKKKLIAMAQHFHSETK